jgi:hypothetical protein
VASTCTPTGGARHDARQHLRPGDWTEAGSPDILPFDTSIYSSVTLEPCAVVRIARKATVTVNPGGSLVAQASWPGP